MVDSTAAGSRASSASGAHLKWVTLTTALLIAAGTGAYFAYSTIETQRSDIAALVRELASTSNERDNLLLVRAHLTSHRDQLSADLDGQRMRAEGAEVAVAEANSRISTLETEAQASSAQIQRLNEQVTLQRQRVQDAQLDARDTETARRRAERVRDAALTYGNAIDALTKTRERMIQVSRAQISAERASQWSTANSLLAEYNSLVPVHNRQVDAANAAWISLRNLL